MDGPQPAKIRNLRFLVSSIRRTALKHPCPTQQNKIIRQTYLINGGLVLNAILPEILAASVKANIYDAADRLIKIIELGHLPARTYIGLEKQFSVMAAR